VDCKQRDIMVKIKIGRKKVSEIKDKVLAVGIFEGKQVPKELAQFTKGITKKQFEGKLGQTYAATTLGKAGFDRLLLIGLGKAKEFNLDFARRMAGTAVRYAESNKAGSLCISVLEEKTCLPVDIIQASTEGAILAGYKFTQFKTKKEDIFDVGDVYLVLGSHCPGAQEAVQRGTILAEAQNFVRDLNELPANIATPTHIADNAKKLAKQNKIKIKIIEKAEMKKLGMGGILAVNRGSDEPPKLVVLEYNSGKKLPLYSIVGKGITFDSGGISLKPSKGMEEMKYDKTGALVVLGIMKAVSELKLPIRLLGLMPLTENMPSGSAQKPGDIIKAYNGKTIEVINTDAEGRLILADALAYAAKQKPKAIIDLATLTGAVIVCLGRAGAGLMSNDDKLAKTIQDSGLKTYERVWRLPLWQDYTELMKSDFADLKNVSGVGEAGTITAAAFLKEFVGETKWAHLDIAGVDLVNRPHPYFSKGATGTGVRLVTEALKNLSSRK
jgi:leucyl aminopeptidase